MIQDASELLHLDREFYKTKHELLLHASFEQISKKLYKELEHAYFGYTTCIAMHAFKSTSIIFVGNSAGYIRAFSMETQEEKRPLYDANAATSKQEVISIDIS